MTRNAEARSGVCPNPATGENRRYNVASEVCCGGNIYGVERGDRPLCCKYRNDDVDCGDGGDDSKEDIDDSNDGCGLVVVIIMMMVSVVVVTVTVVVLIVELIMVMIVVIM